MLPTIMPEASKKADNSRLFMRLEGCLRTNMPGFAWTFNTFFINFTQLLALNSKEC